MSFISVISKGSSTETRESENTKSELMYKQDKHLRMISRLLRTKEPAVTSRS